MFSGRIEEDSMIVKITLNCKKWGKFLSRRRTFLVIANAWSALENIPLFNSFNPKIYFRNWGERIRWVITIQSDKGRQEERQSSIYLQIASHVDASEWSHVNIWDLRDYIAINARKTMRYQMLCGEYKTKWIHEDYYHHPFATSSRRNSNLFPVGKSLNQR